MATFCDRFTSYYLTSHRDIFHSWQPKHERNASREKRTIDIAECARSHPLPKVTKEKVDRLITREIHEQLIATEFNARFFEERGFKVLKGKDTHVVEHPEIPGVLIKTALEARTFYNLDGTTFKQKNTNLLRVAGHQYYSKKNQDPDFLLPEEYLYESPHAHHTEPLHHRFYALSEKMNFCSSQESLTLIQNLKKEEQLKVAKKVCDFIENTGYVDLHSENIYLLKKSESEELQYVVIDQEPVAFFTESNDLTTDLAKKKEAEVTGLITFRDNFCRYNGLSSMAHYVDERIKASENAIDRGEIYDIHERVDFLTILKIIITIPLFFIILPLLAWYASRPLPEYGHIHESL